MPDKDEHRKSAGETGTQAPPKPKPSKPKPRKLPPWKVILHNDDHNEMLDVVKTIAMLTPLTIEVAMRRMLEAHTGGSCLLLTTHKERAELYRDQFVSRKLTVTIEPA